MAALEEAFGDVIQRQITDDASFERWKGSSARKEIVAFVTRLNNSCVNKSNLRLDGAPPQVRKLMDALRQIATGCDQYLPKPGEARRYGSPTFRDWHAWLVASAPELLASLGSDSAELAARLAASFGDRTRIDYGTGHECAFVVFLLGCCKLQLLSENDVDSGAVVCGCFAEYIRTCRVIQRCFGLEPAGSKGVWALDDYQLLPFLFGCSQLADESKGFGDEDTGLLTVNASSLSQRSMFYECLAFVDEQTGQTPLDVAAPILFNLTMQPWRTNARRLLRLFDEEVLGQKPVVQHMLFGELLRADWDSNTGPSEESERLARMKAVMDAANRKLGIERP